MQNHEFYIGIDIGGTKINTALIDEKGNIFEKQILKTSENIDENVLIQNLSSFANSLKSKYQNIVGIGIGAAGVVSHKTGLITFSPNIGWRNFDISSALKKTTNLKVFVDNDASAASWGIFYLNYKKKFKDMICVTLGTGIGGGLIFDGKLYRGADGASGEIGHMHYIVDGKSCSCGSNGCFERYAGTRGIIELAEQYLKENPNSLISKYKNDDGKITPRSISLAANDGDEIARKIWREIGEILGTLLANLVNLLNVEAIHLTGGIAQAEPWISDSIKNTLKKRAFAIPANRVTIIFGDNNHDAGVIGAGLLALEEYHQCQLKK